MVTAERSPSSAASAYSRGPAEAGPPIGNDRCCGDLAELRLDDPHRLLDLVARFRRRELGQLVVMHGVGADGAERLVGKGPELVPVHDQLAAMGVEIEAVVGAPASRISATRSGSGILRMRQ